MTAIDALSFAASIPTVLGNANKSAHCFTPTERSVRAALAGWHQSAMLFCLACINTAATVTS